MHVKLTASDSSFFYLPRHFSFCSSLAGQSPIAYFVRKSETGARLLTSEFIFIGIDRLSAYTFKTSRYSCNFNKWELLFLFSSDRSQLSQFNSYYSTFLPITDIEAKGRGTKRRRRKTSSTTDEARNDTS